MACCSLLLLCEYPTLLGGERSMLTTLAAVRDAGFEVEVAAPPVGPLREELNRRGVPVVPWQLSGDDTQRLPLRIIRERLRDLIAGRAPDLVHANSLATSRISGPVVHELGVPSVGHLRDIVRLSRPAIADLNLHTRLVAVSQATRAFHVATGVSAEKSVVLYNGVVLDEFRPREKSGYLHRELNLPPDHLLIGTIGQIILRKGLDVLLAAAYDVVARRSDVHFLVVGERVSDKAETRALGDRLQAAAREGPLRGRLHLVGSRTDVPAILNELTLLVHPARQEPLGRVLLEAAASGVAVVATDVGGTGEIFPLGQEAACLVPAGDPAALVGAIRGLLEDPAQCRRMALAARRRVETAFDARTAAEQLVQLYRETMNSRPNG